MSEFWRSRVIGQLQRDSAIGALKLGALLRRHGDLQGAEAAFRRADKRGDAEAALSLGELLERRGQLAGAEAAFERAIERASRTPRSSTPPPVPSVDSAEAPTGERQSRSPWSPTEVRHKCRFG
jgi:tetratricopeptide (TPR) repeat protein